MIPEIKPKEIRDKMDGEVRIDGFNEESKWRFCTEYFGSEESKNLLLYEENKSLPDTRTKIYETIRELAMDRTTLKTFGCKSSQVKDITKKTSILAKFAWKALNKDIQHLLLNKVSCCLHIQILHTIVFH